jgi:tRNA pseudouridine13 synthase
VIDPLNPPRLFVDSIGRAIFKAQPEDFIVEEVLGFEPSGTGEHCLLWVEKTNHNSSDVVTHLAERLGLRKRLISHCGLKDRQAVTRQWFSLHLPGKDSPAAEQIETEWLRVLKITRNTRKLHRGSHDGNRFQIRLRHCQACPEEVEARWQNIIKRGVPNYFGPQRFGRQGDNLPQARQFLAGNLTVNDRMLRGLLISAARSYLFNLVVGQRIGQGNWDTPLTGEVFGFAANRSLVLPTNLRGDEAARVQAGELELTAPLWGTGELLSVGQVRAMEQEMVAPENELANGLEKLGLRQERRVMRLFPQNPEFQWADCTLLSPRLYPVQSSESRDLILKFALPRGTYATTVLRELFDFVE